MRPTGIEALRAAQAALGEALAPELQSLYAQDIQRTVQMLLESLASEWDSVAEDLVKDTTAVEGLLGSAREALSRVLTGNEDATSLVKDIDGVLGGPKSESLLLSELSARHNRLRAVMGSVLVFAESTGARELTGLRKDIYSHLRQVACRGWSFWDMASFRGRIEQVRGENAG